MNKRILQEAKLNNNNNNNVVNARPPRPSVCRSLFGKVDHQESMELLQRELTAIAEKDRIKWNFDFKEEKPLEEVNFVWTPVKPNDIIPRPYALERLPFLHEHTCKNAPSTESSKPQVTNTKLKQTSLEQYIKSRKRTAIQSDKPATIKKLKET